MPVHLLRGLDGLNQLVAGWDLGTMSSGSPMQHHAWVRACVETLVPPEDVHTLVVGDLDKPGAVAPFIERRRGGVRMELLGPNEAFEPMDLIYRDEVLAERLCRALRELGIPLLLHRVPADTSTLAVLRRAWRGRGVVISRPARGCPSLSLDESWADPEPPLESSKRRSDLRRARRRAEEIGPVTYQIVAPRPEELDALLEEVLRVEAASWKMEAGTALLADPPRAAFYRRFAAAAAGEGSLRLCFLRIGDTTAAVQLAVEMAGRFWLLKVGYDDSFRRCSPGMLLLADTVRDAARRGLLSYEFLGMAEPWIEVWTKRVRPHVDVRAYPAGLRGGAALASDMLHAAWSRMTRPNSRRS